MTISVLVRCLNEGAHLPRLFHGLALQRCMDTEVVLIDSGSTDNSIAIAEQAGARVISITPEQFSFGRALNLGAASATGEILVAASAHVYPLHDRWLENLVAPLRSQDVALAYGRQVGDERTRFSERRILAQWFPELSEPAQRHPFCNNANAAIRRELWERWPWDEELTGLEDMHWAKRALDAGYTIAYVAGAEVVHGHEEDRRRVMNRYRREALAHRAIYGDQRMHLAEAVRLAAWNIATDLAVAARRREMGALGDIVGFRAAQFIGTYRGFAQSGPVTAALKRRFYYPPTVAAPAPRQESPGTPIDYGPDIG